MTWNWQQSDWPHFTWDSGRLSLAEREFLLGGGVLVGTVKHLPGAEHDQLTVEAMSTEALTTSEIEGELAWFERTGPGAKDALPALTRAGIAHLYFECIHPFEDGNSRIGRAIAEKPLRKL
jgi:Fic family protein